jgi:HEPN domain-containing protein
MAAIKESNITEFTKTKMHFALALLATLFALHHIIEKYEDVGFDYLGYPLKIYYAYGLTAALLALTVYFYAMGLLSERAYSWMEKMGNYVYGLAIMVLPIYGGLYVSTLAAEHLGQEHLAWAGPSIPLALGAAWLLLSQVFALFFRKRLSDRDRSAQTEQLAEQEITSLNRASELFDTNHYDLSVIEAWKAIEARLRRVLLLRGLSSRVADPQTMIHAATRAGLLSPPALALLKELRRQWNIAVSVEPLTREAAETALSAARNILSTIPIEKDHSSAKPTV